MAKIPQNLHEHINTAFPENTIMIGSVLPDGFAQFTPRGSVFVYDDEHLGIWERGRGSTNASLQDGSKLTIFYRNRALAGDGPLPMGGIARFYGTAKIADSEPLKTEIFNRIVKPEQEKDPEMKGFGVLVKVERAENLGGKPLEGS